MKRIIGTFLFAILAIVLLTFWGLGILGCVKNIEWLKNLGLYGLAIGGISGYVAITIRLLEDN